MKPTTTEPKRQSAIRPCLRLGWAMGIAALSGTAQATWDCASLTAVSTADATITSAVVTDPPATVGGVAVTVSFCRVQGIARPSIDSEIKFEVWLPPTATDCDSTIPSSFSVMR